jgi:hypothetical protein
MKPIFSVKFDDDPTIMAWDRVHSCTRKVRHGTQAEADRTVERLRAKGRDLEAYACTYCGGWHTGHRRGSILGWVLRVMCGRKEA